MAPSSSAAQAPSDRDIALPSELLLLAESQWLFTEAELSRAPSILAGCSEKKERENRIKGVNFILQVGIMLKLPQITLSTASVFFHRFFMRHAMEDAANPKGLHYYPIAATCLFLATKVEENCRKLRELVIACVKVAQKDPQKEVDDQDKEFWRWKDNINLYEDLVMEALCFDFSLDSPYKTLFELLLRFKAEDNKRLRNAAWAFVNDSCVTVMCLLFPSRMIAASALYAATKHCDVSFAEDEQGRPWWELVGVDLAEMRKACNFLADIYQPIQASRLRKSSISYERASDNADVGAGSSEAGIEGADNTPIQEDREANGHQQSTALNTETEMHHGKRKREEESDSTKNQDTGAGGNALNGATHDHQSNDRQRVETKVQTLSQRAKLASPSKPPGQTADAPQSGDVGGGLVSPRIDDVSEEGEVED